MKAKLVTVSFMVRVIVNDDANDDEAIELAQPKVEKMIHTDYYECVESVVDDTECPYGTFEKDKS